jgi:hypothetical protein
MKLITYSKLFFTACIFTLLTSCGSSVTNVWDYYVTNEVVVHKEGETAISKRKLLLQKMESVNKSQLDLVAVKQDSNVFLVIGSHKVSKQFFIHDSLYSFDVTDLYSNVRGNDFIRQMGDLSIYFTHVPKKKCDEFLANLEPMKKQFFNAKVSEGSTTQIDFYFSHNVFVSFLKTKQGQEAPKTCNLWVGRRKHELSVKEFGDALNAMKNFN